MDHLFLFANSVAGRGRGRRLASRLADHFRAQGREVDVVFDRIEETDPAVLRPDTRAVIVVGGDGTLRHAAAWMYPSTVPRPPILMVPLGTANLMGHHLGLDCKERGLEAQTDRILSTGKVVLLDAAAANGRLFLEVAGVGIDALIVHELERARNGGISKLSYLQPIVRALWSYDYPPLSVAVDGQIVFPGAPAVAFVGNVSEYGTGFPILSEARSDDGLLDVCVLPCRSHAQLLDHLLHSAAGDHLQGTGVVYARGRRIVIDSPKGVPAEIDGEAAGNTPLAAEVLSTHVAFLTPGDKMPA